MGIIPLCPQRVTFLNHYPASSHRDTNAKEIISNNFLFCDTKNSTTLPLDVYFFNVCIIISAIIIFIAFGSPHM